MMLLPQNMYFDTATKQYRYKNSNKIVSDSNLQRVHIRGLLQAKRYSDRLVDSLTDNKITFIEFQQKLVVYLKDLKISSLELAKGGKSQTYAVDYLNQARQLRLVDYPSLKKLFVEISQGQHTPKMIKARLHNFWKSSRQAFEYGRREIATDKGDTHCKRQLAIAEHCEDCIRYAAMGVMPIGELPLPTEQCECRMNCKCSILYGKLTDLI